MSALVKLRAAPRRRHPFRERLFGILPRELHTPVIWRQAAIALPIVLALIVGAMAVMP